MPVSEHPVTIVSDQGAIDCYVPVAASVYPGATIRASADGSLEVESAHTDDAAHSLVVLTGMQAGQRIPLSQPVVVGRAESCAVAIHDERVSLHHLVIWPCEGLSLPVVEDLGSTNGTIVNGQRLVSARMVDPNVRLGIGAIDLSLQGAADDRPADLAVGPEGTILFNRPPSNDVDRPKPNLLTAPVAPRTTVGPRPFRVTAFLLPLVAGAVMIRLTHNVMFAVFMALSPLMMVANFVTDRKRHRFESLRDAKRYENDFHLFERELASSAMQFTECLDADFPNIAEILRRCALPSRRLWERRLSDSNALTVRVGTGTYPAQLVQPPIPQGVREIVGTWSTLVDAPIAVNLGPKRILGLVGPPEVIRSIARSLIVQLTVLHGPADLSLGLVTDEQHALEWDWLKWLPHLSNAHLRIGVEEFSEAIATSFEARHFVMVVDLGAGVEDGGLRTQLIQRCFDESDMSLVLLADHVDALPSRCTDVLECVGDAGFQLTSQQATDAGLRTGARSSARVVADGVAAALTRERAEVAARSLARFKDPEVHADAVALPDFVSLANILLGPATQSVASVVSWIECQWGTAKTPVATFGIGPAGLVTLDLATDGPHFLIGGTTGAGKSELLRTMVISLALTASPEELTFVFVDYKGGSAFDVCVSLPHCVGIVTDLDEYRSERAMVSLEAELRYRERLLRDAGCSDRDSYARSGSVHGPMPRLMVVVDEFATLKTELPAFVDALVDVAQRGRSLGVHLVLATQRPTGVVSDNIRANTEVKIALRMHERPDSMDILGSADAALLPKRLRGRALIRSGAESVVQFQAAYTGGSAPFQPLLESRMPVVSRVSTVETVSRVSTVETVSRVSTVETVSRVPTVETVSRVPTVETVPTVPTVPAVPTVSPVGERRPFVLHPAVLASREGLTPGHRQSHSQLSHSQQSHSHRQAPADVTRTELDALVDAVCETFTRLNGNLPRRPWVDEPPAELTLPRVLDHVLDHVRESYPQDQAQATAALRSSVGIDLEFGVTVGLCDDPQHQQLTPLRWELGAGNLALVGTGTMPSEALRTVALAIASSTGGATTHCYVLSADRSLDALASLPHCGAVVPVSDRDRMLRLVRMLTAELMERTASGNDFGAEPRPRIVLLVNGLAFIKSDLDDVTLPNNPWDQLVRVLTEGAKYGIHCCVTVERASLLVGALSQVAAQRWMFAGVAAMDLSLLGIRSHELRPLREGECIDVESMLIARLALVPHDFSWQTYGAAPSRPKPVDVLPKVVHVRDLDAVAQCSGGVWTLPLGIDDESLRTSIVTAYPGEHMLVCGASRSGRSNVLRVLAEVTHESDVDVRVVASARSPLRNIGANSPTSNVRRVAFAELAEELADFSQTSRPMLVLVDDAELVEDQSGVLKGVLANEQLPVLVVASVRSEVLRGNYAHWTRTIRRSRLSVLLRPTEIDADFCGVPFMRRGVPTHIGRAIVHTAAGSSTVQVALAKATVNLEIVERSA